MTAVTWSSFSDLMRAAQDLEAKLRGGLLEFKCDYSPEERTEGLRLAESWESTMLAMVETIEDMVQTMRGGMIDARDGAMDLHRRQSLGVREAEE